MHDVVSPYVVGAKVEIVVRGNKRDEVVCSDVEMIERGKGDQAECSILEVPGPVELEVLMGAEVESPAPNSGCGRVRSRGEKCVVEPKMWWTAQMLTWW